MLNSCAAGVTVVNIDNGFGAASRRAGSIAADGAAAMSDALATVPAPRVTASALPAAPRRRADDRPRAARAQSRHAHHVGRRQLSLAGAEAAVPVAARRPSAACSTRTSGTPMRIVERSNELKGAFMKLAQMLSMRSDLLPAEALEVLAAVQSSVPPMAAATIREQVAARARGAAREDVRALRAGGIRRRLARPGAPRRAADAARRGREDPVPRRRGDRRSGPEEHRALLATLPRIGARRHAPEDRRRRGGRASSRTGCARSSTT